MHQIIHTVKGDSEAHVEGISWDAITQKVERKTKERASTTARAITALTRRDCRIVYLIVSAPPVPSAILI